MKLKLLERTIICCLVGSATIAIASGWKRADPTAGEGVSFVSLVDEPAIEHNLARIVSVQREGGDDAVEEELELLVKAVEKSAGSGKEEKRNELKEALTKVFRERTEAQRTRITGMKERLNAIESQLDRRSKLEEQIVQRRLGELLGDKDELSWDHEPASESFEIAERRRGSREPTDLAIEYTFEFPKELPTYGDSTSSAGQASSWKNRFQLQQATKLAEERVAHAHEDASKRAREAQTLAARAQEKSAQVKGEMGWVTAAREKDANLQEVRNRLSRDLKKTEDRLPGLEGLRGSLLEEQAILERYRGRDAEAEALRVELAAVRAQSEMLKKQLDELSKQKSEGSKQRERP